MCANVRECALSGMGADQREGALMRASRAWGYGGIWRAHF